jgi:NitT/TauT family transport system substrate-binding protein
LRWLVFVLSLIAVAAPATSHAEVLRLVVGGVDKQIYLPVMLAERLGYFAEQGLEVQLQPDSSGVRAEDKLLTGGVHGVVGFYDHTIVLQAKGKFVRSVVQFSRAPGEALLAPAKANGVTSPADFGGRTLGVAGLGASTQLLTQYFGVTHGVKPGKMTFVALDSAAAFSNAIVSGRVDAGMATEPVVSSLIEQHRARLLVDLRTPAATMQALGGPYPGACLYLSAVWIDAHRAQTQKLVNAIVKALHYIDTHTAEDIAKMLPTAYFLGDRARYVTALDADKSMFTTDGVMPPDGPATVLKVMSVAAGAVQGRPIDLARTYTDDFAAAAR